jgi:hypothetical protein
MAPADLARPLARPAAMPPACVGHALAAVAPLGATAATFFVLGVGNYTGHGLAVETGGYLSPDGGLPGCLSLLRRAVRGCVQAVGAPRLALGQALT